MCVVTSLAASEGGWRNTRWGMTVEQVQAACPEAQAVKDGKVGRGTLSILDFTIEPEHYCVDFYFEAGGLCCVRISKEAKYESEVEDAISKLKELLTQKYGQPDLREPGTNGSFKTTWNQHDLTVVLNFVNCPSVLIALLEVKYKRPETASLEKL